MHFQRKTNSFIPATALPYLFILVASILCGCNAGPELGVQNSKVSYTDLRADILIPQCVSCHSDVVANGGVSFASYSSTMASPGAVVPFQAYASQMYRQVVEGKMPPNSRLPDALRLQIYNWISLGARDD